MASVRALSHYWFSIQSDLFPWLEEQLGELTENEQRLVTTLDLIELSSLLLSVAIYVGGPRKSEMLLLVLLLPKLNTTCRQPGLYWTDWHVIKSYGASVVGNRRAEYQANQHFQEPSLNLLIANYRRMSIRQ
jgi:hypothetical protein